MGSRLQRCKCSAGMLRERDPEGQQGRLQRGIRGLECTHSLNASCHSDCASLQPQKVRFLLGRLDLDIGDEISEINLHVLRKVIVYSYICLHALECSGECYAVRMGNRLMNLCVCIGAS